MSKVSLEQVKELAQQLSPEDRRDLFYFLAELPDSGIQSQKLEPPPITLDDAKETQAPIADSNGFVVLSTDTVARLMLKGRTIQEGGLHLERCPASGSRESRIPLNA